MSDDSPRVMVRRARPIKKTKPTPTNCACPCHGAIYQGEIMLVAEVHDPEGDKWNDEYFVNSDHLVRYLLADSEEDSWPDLLNEGEFEPLKWPGPGKDDKEEP